jgi:hypothetical protein
MTSALELDSAAEIAAKKPEAPPPMMVIFKVFNANALQDTQLRIIFFIHSHF